MGIILENSFAVNFRLKTNVLNVQFFYFLVNFWSNEVENIFWESKENLWIW